MEVFFLGRLLGTCMDTIDTDGSEITYLAFEPAPGVNLPSLIDLIVDFEGGWVTPIRGEGGGEAVDPAEGRIDLVELLHSIPRSA